MLPGTRDTLFEGPKARGGDPRQAVVDFHQQASSGLWLLVVSLGPKANWSKANWSMNANWSIQANWDVNNIVGGGRG